MADEKDKTAGSGANPKNDFAAEADARRKEEASLLGDAIGAGIAKALGTGGAITGAVGEEVPANPEERLDYAPNGGVYKLSDDEEAPLVNFNGVECDEEGDTRPRKAKKGKAVATDGSEA